MSSEYSIVTPGNARTPEYRAHLQKILKSGLCPFCPGGDTLRDQKILRQNTSFWASHNYVPISGSQHHLILVPHRHLEELSEITAEEWLDFIKILAWLKKKFKITGAITYVREGDPLKTGATVSHLHFQFIVPKKIVKLYFGPSP